MLSAALVLLLFLPVSLERDVFGSGRTMRFLASRNVSLTERAVDTLRTFLMFVGYPRSAHSLLGSIVDAHPNAIVANEFHIVARIGKLVSTAQRLYGQLIYNSAHHAAVGREQAGFSYVINTTFQGRWHSPLLLIGDKKGHGTTKYLRRHWQDTLDKLRWLKTSTGLNLKFLHVLRNPYDNIATMVMRLHLHSDWLAARQSQSGAESRNATFQWRATANDALDEYLSSAQVNDRFIGATAACSADDEQLGRCVRAQVWTLDGKQLLQRPEQTLKHLSEYLDIPFNQQWSDKCRETLFDAPFPSRLRIMWPSSVVERIRDELQQLKNVPLLAKMAQDTSGMTIV